MRPVYRIRLENTWREDLGHNRKHFVKDTEQPDIGLLRILLFIQSQCAQGYSYFAKMNLT